MGMKWKPESKVVYLQSGAAVYLSSEPDGLWRIRNCNYEPRSECIDAALFLQTPTAMRPNWLDRTFASDTDAVAFVAGELGTRPIVRARRPR
jgi:hypothetical protein